MRQATETSPTRGLLAASCGAVVCALALVAVGCATSALPPGRPVAELPAPVVAEHPAQGHTGRQVGHLAATLGTDGSLANVSWASLWLGEDIADDKAMGIVLDAAR